MIRLLRLGGDESGTSVIELALVAPLLASFLVGMVDLSRAYSFQLGLQQVVQRSIEKVQQYQESTSTFSTMQNEVVSASQAAGYTDVSATNGSVALDFWLECDGVRQADYESSCSAGQNYARYVSVSVHSKFTPIFQTSYFPGSNADGTYTITSEAGMRTQ
jgi:Flp pilus assembly protein TadG